MEEAILILHMSGLMCTVCDVIIIIIDCVIDIVQLNNYIANLSDITL